MILGPEFYLRSLIQTFWIYFILFYKTFIYIYLTFDIWGMFGFFVFIIPYSLCTVGGISPKRTVLVCFLIDELFFAFCFDSIFSILCPGSKIMKQRSNDFNWFFKINSLLFLTWIIILFIHLWVIKNIRVTKMKAFDFKDRQFHDHRAMSVPINSTGVAFMSC